ncbi:MAG: hypothetical protein V9G12_03700 [Microthrixaceae bacterium]
MVVPKSDGSGSSLARSYRLTAVRGAVAWVSWGACAWWLYGAANFADRDDGVITLAHARHLADHGVVGLGPFDQRVAGFSAPLHFVVGWVYYAVGGSGYHGFNVVLTFVSLAFVGAFCTWIIRSETIEWASRRTQLSMAAAAAVVQALSFSFYGWNASGLENPFVVALLLGAVALAPRALESTVRSWSFGLVIGLLAVTRLDTISLALPITVVAIWPLLHDRPAKWITKVVVIATPSAVFGLGTVVSFWAYFGQVVPTTVDNRVRSPIAVAALAVVSLVAFAIMAGALDRFGRLHADSEARDLVRRSTIRTFAVVGASAVLLVVAVTALADWNQVAATLSASIACGLLWTGALLVVAAISPTLRSGRFRYFVVIALWVPSYEIVFGPTRLAVSRVVASSVPALSIVAVIIVARAVLLVRAAAEGPSTARQRTPIRAVYASVALLPLVVLSDASGIGDRAVTEATYSTVIDLCCSIEPIAEMNIDIGRDTVAEVDERIVPIIAVPDIGKVAFADAVNIVDTGMIGDPVYTKIATAPEGPFRDEMMRFYLFEVYPPDVWDLHEPYSCQLAPVQADRRFDGWYRRLDIDRVGRTDFLAPNSCPGDYVQGLFVLRDPASRPDLVLAKELLSGTPPEASFFEACRTEDELDDCFDHLRAFQRAYPGTAGSERAASLTAGLEDTAPGRLVVALLDAPVSRTWSEDAFDAVTEIVSAKR